MEGDTVRVGDVTVRGVGPDGETRCAHYDGPRDVVAIRFHCCGEWYPCLRCHGAVADHEPTVWPRAAFDERAVLCGVCGSLLAVRAYLDAGRACPACGAAFNPGCVNHYDRYFAVDED